jgi:hypothetical protein
VGEIRTKLQYAPFIGKAELHMDLLFQLRKYDSGGPPCSERGASVEVAKQPTVLNLIAVWVEWHKAYVALRYERRHFLLKQNK